MHHQGLTPVTDTSASRARSDPASADQLSYEALLRRAGYGRFLVAADGRVAEANDALATMLGWPAGFEPLTMNPETDLCIDGEEWQRVIAAAPKAVFSEWISMGWKRRDGGAIAVRVAVRCIADEGGIARWEGVAEDVTERQRRDELLRRSERMASIGTTLAGVAHELNNPLAAIIGFSQLLLKRPLTTEDRVALEAINHEAMRSAAVVRNLLAMVRRRGGDRRVPTNVNDIAGYILRTRRYALETAGIMCRVELDPALPLVLGDLAQLEQVMLNLLRNAEQALLPAIDARQTTPAWITIRTRREDPNVIIEVEDNGPGVRDDHSTRIWDAFWTTKDEGEGTGLGLSVAHSIVAEHGGSIVLERPADGGARFVVRIPMANSTPEINSVDHAVRPLDVLVVDPLVEDAEFVERFLTSRGHAVVRAASIDIAVKLATHAAFDVILCDARLQPEDETAALDALAAAPGAARARFVLSTARHVASESVGSAADSSPRIATPARTYDIEQLRRLIEGA